MSCGGIVFQRWQGGEGEEGGENRGLAASLAGDLGLFSK